MVTKKSLAKFQGFVFLVAGIVIAGLIIWSLFSDAYAQTGFTAPPDTIQGHSFSCPEGEKFNPLFDGGSEPICIPLTLDDHIQLGMMFVFDFIGEPEMVILLFFVLLAITLFAVLIVRLRKK